MTQVDRNSGLKDPWEGTLSHEIYTSLKKIDEEKKVEVLHKGTDHEIFCFGNDQAHLYKRLEDGSVGESNGVIRAYVELHEIYSKEWWKLAIGDNIHRSVKLLPVSLEQLAIDAKYESESWMLNPRAVAMKYELLKQLDDNEKMLLKKKISNMIKETLKDLCKDNFEIREDNEAALRLVPLTNDAKLIDLGKNGPYQEMVKKISEFLVKLKSNYKSLL